ncbi:endonuclease/exonuclease/phosphatase family protein [uncultured Lacinutrix sp.]|uniref:endonuclease/exonuclease/phosphatase family protein n=1 Tax=uncultured Lacinutrix sp. TaxID=574032 RepID=UPI00260DD0A8|nr:endonuclease/exonuclease/phosphatase family protein [uncultured Lacinutrix sp.]
MAFIQKYKAYILGIYAFLVFVHFVIKDYIFPISIIFYAFPIIIIIPFGLLTSWFYRKKKVLVYFLIGFSLILSYHWFNNYYVFPVSKTLSEKDSSILFWNVAKNSKGLPLDVIFEKIKEYNIDILTFVEAENILQKDIIALKKEFRDYSFKKLKGNMLIGVKGKIDSVFYKSKKKSYKFNIIESTIDGTTSKIIIVDIYASPFFSKRDALKDVLSFSTENNIDIIVGDFNTPYESIHFKNYEINYKSFHDYSDGLTATWPYGIPLLELDQIWLNKTNQPIQLNKFQYLFSDHKLLIAEYRSSTKKGITPH